MAVTFLQKIAFAFKKTYCALLTALLHVKPGELEDGWENGIALGYEIKHGRQVDLS